MSFETATAIPASSAAIMATFYDDYGCYIGTPGQRKIIDFMEARPYTQGYARTISDLRDDYMLTIGEAGRYWSSCEFTREHLSRINDQIKEVFEDARDRYADWASD